MTPKVVLWPPRACAPGNKQMCTHILTHFCPCIHNIHVFKKIAGPVMGKWWLCRVLSMPVSHALKKLSLLHTMERTFGLHDCPSPPPPVFQSTCSLLPMTQILYYISTFILFFPWLVFYSSNDFYRFSELINYGIFQFKFGEPRIFCLRNACLLQRHEYIICLVLEVLFSFSNFWFKIHLIHFSLWKNESNSNL